MGARTRTLVAGVALIVVAAALAVGIALFSNGTVPGQGPSEASGDAPAEQSLTVVRGVIGSEKESLFADPEAKEIFARYGTVAHAVILATVDNASRRRGFIVMNHHHEAKVAMDALNRKEIK